MDDEYSRPCSQRVGYPGVAFDDSTSGENVTAHHIFRVSDLARESNEPISRLTGHLAHYRLFRFSPDNKRVVTISDDGGKQPRLFDVALGCEVHLLDTEGMRGGAVWTRWPA